jgi:hypothetical protein
MRHLGQTLDLSRVCNLEKQFPKQLRIIHLRECDRNDSDESGRGLGSELVM